MYIKYDRITMNWIFVFIILNCVTRGYFQICTPSITIPPVETPTPNPIQFACRISSGIECDNLISIEFHKRHVNTTESFKKVFEMDSNGQGTAFPDKDYNLTGRATGNRLTISFFITIQPSVIDDSGIWQCVVVKADLTISGNTAELTVTEKPSEELSVRMLHSGLFLLGVAYEYQCEISRVYPAITPVWKTGDTMYTNGTTELIPNGYVWRIRNTIQLRANSIEDINATCIFDKTTGETWNKNKTLHIDQNDIRTPAIIEYSTSGATNVNIWSNLTMVCIASGSGATITWLKDGEVLEFPNHLFERTTETTSGNFTFAQESALKSVLIWKPPPSTSTAMCEDKTRHDGVYKCLALGLEDSMAESENISIAFIHINGCISIGGLIGIIIGTIFGVILIVFSILLVFYRCCETCFSNYCGCCKKSLDKIVCSCMRCCNEGNKTNG